MRIIHASDLHIDSPLLGLEAYESVPLERIRNATRRALEQLVTVALEQKVDLLVIAGDLFDGSWRDYSPGLFFTAKMRQLREGNVQVVWARGNHDAESRIRRHLRLPDNVHEFSTRKAETLELEALGLAVHGQGFERREVTENLAAGYPDPIPGAFNLGVLHTALEGRPGHDAYAPCSVKTLVDRGYQYWALGHVHQREIVSRSPWVVFPGNLQGRFVRESGPKGAMLIDVQENQVQSVDPVIVDTVRWETCLVDASNCVDVSDVIQLVRSGLESAARGAPDRLLAARVIISGATKAHQALTTRRERVIEEVRNAGLEALSGEIWIERVLFDTRPCAEQGLLLEKDELLGDLSQLTAEVSANDVQIEAIREEFKPLLQRLGELSSDLEGNQLGSSEHLRRTLGRAEELLIARLLEGNRS